MFNLKARRELKAQFLDTARKHLGTRLGLAAKSHTTLNNPYGERIGYPNGVGPGKKWDGAFLDVVAHDSSVSLPSFVDPASALQYFVHANRLYLKPRPGDVVFFAYDGHVGLVTEVHLKNRTFKSIEAGVSSGLPRASKEPDGIFERTHAITHDVIGFGRPRFEEPPSPKMTPPGPGEKKLPLVHPSNFQYGKKHRSTELVQLALGSLDYIQLQDVDRGKFDLKTRAAYAQYQRHLGYAAGDATGIPDEVSLVRLAQEAGMFRVRGASSES